MLASLPILSVTGAPEGAAAHKDGHTTSRMTKTAVVLFNLGGPDRLDAVQPFLFNLFNDPNIVDVPGPARWLLARFIAKRRGPVSREIYGRIGGKSPLLERTMRQRDALTEALSDLEDVRVFVSMRYWHPMSDEIAAAVADYGPDEIILLPLYPQFSRTTAGSSLRDWRRAAGKAGLRAPSRAICCYPTTAGLVAGLAELVRKGISEAAGGAARVRVLFSAHGLPRRVVARGDPYQWQVEQTAAALVSRLGIEGLDWVVCYQSRVGPLRWIGPATDAEIVRAGAEGLGVVVVPIAFVSEHSETLVELDIDYRNLAADRGVPVFVRVPALGTDPAFIDALAHLVREAREQGVALCSQSGGRYCPAGLAGCAFAQARAPGATEAA